MKTYRINVGKDYLIEANSEVEAIRIASAQYLKDIKNLEPKE